MVVKRGDPLSIVKGNLVYRLFYPQVAMVICSMHEGSVGAMPAVSCISISDEPPIVALAVSIRSRTNWIIKKSRKFSVNWVDQRNVRLRRLIIDLARPVEGPDKLRVNNAPYTIELGAPVIAGCSAYAICRVRKVNRLGDHDLFVAEVVLAKAVAEAFVTYWNFKRYKPSIYFGSNETNPLRSVG